MLQYFSLRLSQLFRDVGAAGVFVCDGFYEVRDGYMRTSIAAEPEPALIGFWITLHAAVARNRVGGISDTPL
jgi:hypothetical protein